MGRRGWRQGIGWLCGLALVVSCASGDDTPADNAAPETTETTEVPTPPGPFAVGRRDLELVDASRATPAVPDQQIAEAGERRIQVTLVYPAGAQDGEAGTEPEAAAPIQEAPAVEGRFPLIIFAHGVNNLAEYFVWLGASLAREGYVVALPTFPLSRAEIGFYDDYVNQPADVSFIVDEILANSQDDDDPLAGRVDSERVAVGGYSLGGATVLGVTFNSCCADPRVEAAFSIAGGPLPFESGEYDYSGATPLLVVQGIQDQTVPVAVGDSIFDAAEPPVHYLRLNEADHGTLFSGEEIGLVESAVLAFVDARLKDQPERLEELAATVAATDRAELQVKD